MKDLATTPEVIPTSQAPTIPAGPESGIEELDLAKTCLAFLERLDVGDGKKLFHEVEADVENAGCMVFAAFAGEEDERKSLGETILQAFASE